MGQDLISALQTIKDPRQSSGRRHSLPIILLIIIMASMSGAWGYRSIERHRRELIQQLKIPQARVPSYSTIRRTMMELDFQEVAKVFNH